MAEILLVDAMSQNINTRIYTERFNSGYYACFARRFKKVVSLFPEKGRFLDIGCGDGEIAAIARQKGLDAYGIDIVKQNVAKATAKGVKAKQWDLNNAKLPYPASFFDCIFCGEFLEHTDEPMGILREIRRILKPKGFAIITVPNIAAWYNRFLLFAGFLPFWVESSSEKAYATPYGVVSGHTKAFTKSSIREMLRDLDFRIESISGSPINPQSVAETSFQRLGCRVFYSADSLLSRIPSFASNIIVKAVRD